MNTEHLQRRIDEVSKALSGKGFAHVGVHFNLANSVEPSVFATWIVGEGFAAQHKSHFAIGDSSEERLLALEIWVEEQPTREERQKAEFTEGLGALIEFGNRIGIEADLVNPLMAAMKKLSENALTDQSVVKS